MPEGALAEIIYRVWCISLLCWSGIQGGPKK